jgi:hypothetical protein
MSSQLQIACGKVSQGNHRSKLGIILGPLGLRGALEEERKKMPHALGETIRSRN